MAEWGALELRSVAEWREDLFSAVCELGSLRQYSRNSIVFHQDEFPTAVYAVRSGLVEIAHTSSSGRHTTHSICSGGEVFGYSEIILREERGSTAMVLRQADIHVLAHTDFLHMLATRPQIVMALLGHTLHRLRLSQEMRTHVSARQKLVCALKSTAMSLHGPDSDLVDLTVAITHEGLAHLCDLSRQTVTTILNDLADRGLVELRSRAITIRDLNSLNGLAQPSE